MPSNTENIPTIMIACRVFETLLDDILPNGLLERISYLDYGLHRVPEKLTRAIQEEIDAVETPSLIILGYGLCGNGLKGIQSRQHTLLIPRTDDCIAMFLGSYQTYIQKFVEEPGTYYLTKGWLEAGSDPLKEYQEVREKHGDEDAQWIMDTQYQNYQRLVFVAHKQADLDEFSPKAKEVAHYCKRWNMEYKEMLGSDRYIRRLIEIATSLEKADRDFLVISPGESILQEMFIR